MKMKFLDSETTICTAICVQKTLSLCIESFCAHNPILVGFGVTLLWILSRFCLYWNEAKILMLTVRCSQRIGLILESHLGSTLISIKFILEDLMF